MEMFEPTTDPRIFGVGLGVDFPTALVSGLRQRLQDSPPHAWSRAEIYVNTRRMERRLTREFQNGPALILPKIKLVTDLPLIPETAEVPPAKDPLALRIELLPLVRKLLETGTVHAPGSAAFDLAQSLASLVEEVQGEGVSLDQLQNLDLGDFSSHWQQSRAFLQIVREFLGETMLTTEGRQRRIAETLAAVWAKDPPRHPILVAGSTGSRGATRVFMEAVSKLPQGAVILPGFDFAMTPEGWEQLDKQGPQEDHPQYRFKRLLNRLYQTPAAVRPWTRNSDEPLPRNMLLSLALRPAPYTDGWRTDGPNLKEISKACEQLTLIEAEAPRQEALAIALGLRAALEEGKKAALISPDRVLTRKVAAALQSWGIEPDDSAGLPLPLSAAGRFLRMVGRLYASEQETPALLALLKHPLTCRSERGEHLRRTRDLELEILRGGRRRFDLERLETWARNRTGDEDIHAWTSWLGDTLWPSRNAEPQALQDRLEAHLRLAEALSNGPRKTASDPLFSPEDFDRHADRVEAAKAVESLAQVGPSAGLMTAEEYLEIFHATLRAREVRSSITPHPDVMIWGTLEARVQGADVVILGGLNEGSWPETADHDPWLNRSMRQMLGLLMPERRIGLSAHDFQQATAAPVVWLSRSLRSSETETIPARWLNRLTNLLGGLDKGKPALEAMRVRGRVWCDRAQSFDTPAKVEPANRPAPIPPLEARPSRISVTRVQDLVRDPYSIYARYVLGLSPLKPLVLSPDAPMLGEALHKIFQLFVEQTREGLPENPRDLLRRLAETVLVDTVPWAATRAFWQARIERVTDWYLAGEVERRQVASPIATEVSGKLLLPNAIEVTGRADRIDHGPHGLTIFDYKSGKLPTKDQQTHFDKQIAILALMAEAGAFEGLNHEVVSSGAYIGLGSSPDVASTDFQAGDLRKIQDELVQLLSIYFLGEQHFTSRRAVEKDRFERDYDRLARFGEWDLSDQPAKEPVS